MTMEKKSPLAAASSSPSWLCVGLMSGTSCDGIDAALVEITDRRNRSSSSSQRHPPFQRLLDVKELQQGLDGGSTPSDKPFQARLLHYTEVPYSETLRKRILHIASGKATTIGEVGEVDVAIGHEFGNAALAVVADYEASQVHQQQREGSSPEERHGLMPRVLVVGSHGQTVHHAPRDGVTMQLGCGATIAHITKCWTVTDFRAADVARGGQGAPILPYVDFLLHAHQSESRILLNIGGIANVTVLPADCSPGDVVAFDTGPGNMLMDIAVAHYTEGKEHFDENGGTAAKGKVHSEALSHLLTHPFYAAPPPKSTGREVYNDAYFLALIEKFPGISMEDMLATLCSLTATTIADAILPYVSEHDVRAVRVSGGGANNSHLLRRIQTLLTPASSCQVVIYEDEECSQVASSAREAVAFAILGYEHMRSNSCNMLSVTGASEPCVLGALYPPSLVWEKEE